MNSTGHTLDRYADIQAALADPHLVPLPAGPGPLGSMAWLRATVARFSSGEVHARRRALVEAELARLDPAALRAAAAAGPEVEARLAVVRTLAAAMGLAEPEAVAKAVGAVARAYFGGADPGAEAALAWLLPRVLGGGPAGAQEAELEAAANRIGILVQACDATGDLIENARSAAAGPVEELLTETLRQDPPVRAMRRIAVQETRVGEADIAAGALVLLDVAAANLGSASPPLTFGSGPRSCPGREHALALAAGIMERTPADGTS